MTVDKEKEEVAYVIDTLAVAAPRVHGVRLANGGIKNYSLTSDKAVEMSLDHAMKFLCADSFVVTDANGKRLTPMENMEHATNVPVPHGYVLARFEELSRDALVLRCKLLPGSESIHPKKSSVAEMAEFLLASQPKAEAAKEPSKEAMNALFDAHGING